MNPPITSSRTIEVEGILVPDSWSRQNKVITMAIHSHGEQEYLIRSDDQIDRELKKLLGKRVLIKGVLSGDGSTPGIIHVQRYSVMDW